MSEFSEQFSGQNLVSMHATNPEPFTQIELEKTIGQPFSDIIKNTNLGFAPDQGTEALRHTLVEYLYNGITTNDIITHAGAQEAIYCAFNAVLKSGDRVLVVSPIFEPLVQIPENMGCDVHYVELNPADNWSLDLTMIENQFKHGCKMFVINFPHNPTGATINLNELNQIVSLCEKYGVWLLSDEVFRGLEHEIIDRLPAVADLYDKGISIGVISKAFAVPGLRVGWLVCKNEDFRKEVINIKGYLSICNSQVDEKLVSALLQSADKLLLRNLNIINENKKLLDKVNSIMDCNIDVFLPKAGCCVFARILDDLGSIELVKNMASKHQYLLYPNTLFKTNINAIRIGFGGSRFQKFIEKIR